MSKKTKSDRNLATVSKQTAGGVTGAVLGSMVAGPVGALAGGIAGALVGNSSAKGEKPIERAVDTVRSVGKRGAKTIKATTGWQKLQSATATATKKVAAKSSLAKKAPKKRTATAASAKTASKRVKRRKKSS